MRQFGSNRERLAAILGSVVIHGFVLAVLAATAFTISPALIKRDASSLRVSWITFSVPGMERFKETPSTTEEDPGARKAIVTHAPLRGDIGRGEQPPEIPARVEGSSAVIIVPSALDEAAGRGDGSSPHVTASEAMVSPTAKVGEGGAPGETTEVSVAVPRYRNNARLPYPLTARIRGYEGVVLLTAEVQVDGRVGILKIKKSSGHAVLDRCAYDAVLTWRFEPGRRMGKPVPMWVDVPVRFALRDG